MHFKDTTHEAVNLIDSESGYESFRCGCYLCSICLMGFQAVLLVVMRLRVNPAKAVSVPSRCRLSAYWHRNSPCDENTYFIPIRDQTHIPRSLSPQ
jgi:hypothetical protein